MDKLIIQLIKSLIPFLEDMANRSDSPIDDTVVKVIKVLIGE